MSARTPYFACLSLIASVACNDSSLTVRNTPPNVTFTAPAYGTRFTAGAPITLVAAIGDAETAPDNLALSWQSSDGIVLENFATDGPHTIDGHTATWHLPDGLPVGARTVTLIATDPLASSGQDSIAFTITAPSSPTIAWWSPDQGSDWFDSDTLLVEGQLGDADSEDLRTLSLAWESTLDMAAAPTLADASGHFAFDIAHLPLGTQTVELSVTDAQGQTTQSSVTIEVLPTDRDEDGILANADCDDDNALVYPGATEVVGNGVDEDCDDSELCFTDADGDGYRPPSPSAIIVSTDVDCDDLGEAASTFPATDCDDRRADTRPGATETCNMVDDDCDGQVDDEATLDWATPTKGFLSCADYRLAGQSESDFAGWSLAAAGDVDGDGKADVLVGAPGHDRYGDGAGAAYVFLGASLADDRDLDLADADYRFFGSHAQDAVGWSVTSAGDVDGDGLSDLLFGAPSDNAAGIDAGAAYLVLGASLGASGEFDLHLADAKFLGETAGDKAGSSVASAGDFDGDGLSDLLIGAPLYNHSGATDIGAAYLVRASRALGSATLSLTQADYRWWGEHAHDQAGFSVSPAGDVDGDELSDVLVGAIGHDAGGANSGSVYLLRGEAFSSAAAFELGSASVRITGETTADYAGGSLANAGDVDGDGLSDLLIGAERNSAAGSWTGKAYLIFGASLPVSGNFGLSEADVSITGEHPGDRAGHAVAGVGDIDDDGRADLLIGAHLAGDTDAGQAYLLLGKSFASGVPMSLLAADFPWKGEGPNDYSGWQVSPAGDVNGDGRDDLLIGGVYNGRGGVSAGTAYVLLNRL